MEYKNILIIYNIKDTDSQAASWLMTDWINSRFPGSYICFMTDNEQVSARMDDIPGFNMVIVLGSMLDTETANGIYNIHRNRMIWISNDDESSRIISRLHEISGYQTDSFNTLFYNTWLWLYDPWNTGETEFPGEFNEINRKILKEKYT